MATKRIPNEELGLEVLFSFDWKQKEVEGVIWDTARSVIENTLKDAEEIAKRNVAQGKGPSVHDGRGTDGHRTEDHGFDWEDTGKLAKAIHVRLHFAEMKAGGKKTGMPSGTLVVEPIPSPARQR